jgi:hypothetical protein
MSARVSIMANTLTGGERMSIVVNMMAVILAGSVKEPRFKPSAVSVLFPCETLSGARCPRRAACSKLCFSAANGRRRGTKHLKR